MKGVLKKKVFLYIVQALDNCVPWLTADKTELETRVVASFIASSFITIPYSVLYFSTVCRD